MKLLLLFVIAGSIAILQSCNTVSKLENCAVSYYHDKFEGRRTASGEIFKQKLFTCASNVYPIGTVLKLTNKDKNTIIFVRVNDKGELYGRTLDLSKSAFKALGNLKHGIIYVTIEEVNFKSFN